MRYRQNIDFVVKGLQKQPHGPPILQLHCLLNKTEVYVGEGETIQSAMARSRKTWAESKARCAPQVSVGAAGKPASDT